MSTGPAFPRTYRLAKALLTGSALVVLSACHRGSSAVPRGESLEHGGVYVAYSLGCEQGCREVRRGDVILAVDGKPVDTREELLAAGLTRDSDVRLDVLRPGASSPREVTIRARPGKQLPPLEDTPPFWTVSAQALNRAPSWARSLMFSHAVPPLKLLSVDGGWVTGRSLYGRKTILVMWPDLPMFERQYRNFRQPMTTFYQVLQLAQPYLARADVSTLFAVCGGANDTTVRQELVSMSKNDEEGQPLPPLPVYRCPAFATSHWAPTSGSGLQASGAGSPGLHVGLEHSGQSFFDYVIHFELYFPVIVLIDEGGIVRWHSNDIEGTPKDTIVQAIAFALDSLDERAPAAEHSEPPPI